MKQLTVVRHAKSSWKDTSLPDFDRPLNKRGRVDAPMMGQRLKDHGVMPDLIISSAAKRARKTTKIIAAALDYPKARIDYSGAIYNRESGEIVTLVRALDNLVHAAMLVGHNPELTEVVEELSGQMVDYFPTCGVFCLEFSCSSWQDICADNSEVLFFDCPKLNRAGCK